MKKSILLGMFVVLIGFAGSSYAQDGQVTVGRRTGRWP